jgi:hypothetical protein
MLARYSAGPPLPGNELVEKGLSDLAERSETIESLLVSIGSPRLRSLGFDVSTPFDKAEERLYLLLARDDPNGAHSRYNALVRRLVSFERAAESARSCGFANVRPKGVGPEPGVRPGEVVDGLEGCESV